MECGKYDYRVQPGDVDLTQKASIITLGNHILHAAGEDADRLRLRPPLDAEQQYHMGTLRMAIEMDRYPDEYEHYQIETWVSDINRLMTTRNFILHDRAGNAIGKGCTHWSMIDFKTRLPLDLRTLEHYMAAVIATDPPIDRPAKIAKVNGTATAAHRIRYSDIDFNQHTNSMKYVQWMVDMLPLEKLTSQRLRRLDINFLHETRYGQQVVIAMENSEEADKSEIRPEGSDQAACKAALFWI
ncbi:MAG: acyl-[acyl-carrier-protein] thioesterase [Alistipes indistinctus]